MSKPTGRGGQFPRTRAERHPKQRKVYKPTVPVSPDQLTPDEERYALALFAAGGSNRTQQSVYLEVFPDKAERWALATVHTRASLLAKKVSLRVRQLQDAVAAPKIADAIERQEYWTITMRDGTEVTINRLRASELLEKAQSNYWGDEERKSGPVTNIQYNVTFVTRSRNGDNAQG